MTTMRDFIEAMAAELDRAGITEYEVAHGGKHPRLIYMHNGQRKIAVFPSTPSDPYGLLNKVAFLRRELGLSAPERGKSTRPKKRGPAAPAAEKPPVLTTFTASDPFAVLATWRPAPRAPLPAPTASPRFLWTRTGGRQWRVEVMRDA